MKQALLTFSYLFIFSLFLSPPASAISDNLITGGASSFYKWDERKSASNRSFSSASGTASLSQFRGSVVVLNFWATFCIPCRKEMPDLAELQRDLGSQGLVVIAVSQDESLADVNNFYDQFSLTGLGKYIDTSKRLQKDFDVMGLPVTIIIDRNGNVVGDFQGFLNWGDPDVRNLLKAIL